MTNCGAPGCTNRSANNKNLSFHRLSSRKGDIKKKWLHKLGRKNVPETLSLCSEHFEQSCFERDLQAELMPNVKRKRVLKEDAVPTIFNHSQSPSRKRVFSLEREHKQDKKQCVQNAFTNYENDYAQQDVGCDTKDLIFVSEVGVQNGAKKTKSVRTQYRKEDFIFEDHFVNYTEDKIIIRNFVCVQTA